MVLCKFFKDIIMKNVILFLSVLCTFFVFAYSDSNNPDSDHIALRHQSVREIIFLI